MMEVIDSHAHLNDYAYEVDLPEVLERLKKAGVTEVINVGFDVSSSRRAVEQAHKYEFIHAAVGVHPHDAVKLDKEGQAIIRGLANDRSVVAIGETGLDYYRNLSPRNVQQEVFHWHLGLAHELRLPVIIHDRDAHEDTMKILRKNRSKLSAGGVLHCFSGSWEMARECLDLGLYISFAGPVSFKNAKKLKQVAARVPLDRLLVETDCPYLTPEPHRGTRNEPAYVNFVAEAIGEIKGINPDEIKEATATNARKLFGI
ncbi:MAG: TatD DNase family protein [Clostridia bacterium]|nr:TatD DNase family protein [Clostridia bacterium]